MGLPPKAPPDMASPYFPPEVAVKTQEARALRAPGAEWPPRWGAGREAAQFSDMRGDHPSTEPRRKRPRSDSGCIPRRLERDRTFGGVKETRLRPRSVRIPMTRLSRNR